MSTPARKAGRSSALRARPALQVGSRYLRVLGPAQSLAITWDTGWRGWGQLGGGVMLSQPRRCSAQPFGNAASQGSERTTWPAPCTSRDTLGGLEQCPLLDAQQLPQGEVGTDTSPLTPARGTVATLPPRAGRLPSGRRWRAPGSRRGLWPGHLPRGHPYTQVQVTSLITNTFVPVAKEFKTVTRAPLLVSSH